ELQTDLELRLRQGGVRVENPVQLMRQTGKVPAHLIVSVEALRVPPPPPRSTVGDALYVLTASIELRQPVFLQRDPTIALEFASTWSVEKGSGSTIKELRSDCRQAVRDLIERFLNAYLEQNAKQ